MEDKKRMKNTKFFVFLLVFSLLANFYWGWFFYPYWFPHSVNIPSQHQINNFCKSKDFDNGWLDSYGCHENQVLCSRKIFDLVEYKCFEWEKD
jgi:hypothetical protein